MKLATSLRALEQRVLEDLGGEHGDSDRGRREDRQPRPAADHRDGGDEDDGEQQRADRDDPQEAVRLRGPRGEEVMADEGVLVEALSPVGPDDEQVEDDDRRRGREREDD